MSKFESSRHTKGEIPSYDIKSAYPYELTNPSSSNERYQRLFDSLKDYKIGSSVLGLQADDYQVLAIRTRADYPPRTFTNQEQQIMLGCMGLAGESGEFIDIYKKIFFHNKEPDEDRLIKELGDVLWYVANICDAKGWKMSDIMTLNIQKLAKRYPNGFNYADANNRTNETT